jgi:hypothetical protein
MQVAKPHFLQFDLGNNLIMSKTLGRGLLPSLLGVILSFRFQILFTISAKLALSQKGIKSENGSSVLFKWLGQNSFGLKTPLL